MRQVPAEQKSYLLVGNGRLATHLAHYFSSLELPFETWNRRENSPADLEQKARNAKVVLLAVSDGALASLVETLKGQAVLVHFSGCLSIDGAVGAHPLMTFGPQLYEKSFYEKIPFIVEENAGAFSEVFPRLSNPRFTIKKELKPLYHALCVMSGNFSVLLWQKLFAGLEGRLDIPREAAFPYMERIFQNLRDNPGQALTGPLVRKDFATIRKNLTALEDDSFLAVYEGFLKAYGLPTGSQPPRATNGPANKHEGVDL